MIKKRTIKKIDSDDLRILYAEPSKFWEGVVAIKDHAFANRALIPDGWIYLHWYSYSEIPKVEIEIPNSVEKIGDYAFSGCENLRKIKLPKNLKEISIGLFKKCISLTDIAIPKNVEIIKGSAFSNCQNLQKITWPNNLKVIGGGSFYNCKSLTEIEIPDSVYFIGPGAFSGCQKLQKIKLPNNFKIIRGHAFSGTSLTEIEIPDSVYYIGNEAFQYCTDLSKVNFPKNLKVISDGLFSFCYSLTEMEIPETVEKIGNEAFLACRNLTKVKLPKNLKEISYRLFSGCYNLTEIEIPDGVTKIEESSFGYCSSLTEIEIPDTVQEIKNEVFMGCEKLSKVKLPNRIRSLGDNLFNGCSSLTEIEIPNSVKDIGFAAFKDCKNLKEVKIPNGVTCINNSTFENCSSLTEIEIPDSIKEIKTNAFLECQNLQEVKLPKNLKGIEQGAFKNCISLTEIEIPDSIKEIKADTFAGCQNLSKVKLPKGIKSLGENIFNGCSSLTEVYLPDNLKHFNLDTFANIPNTITFHYKGETLSNKIFPIYEQLKSLCNASDQDRRSFAKINASNLDVDWISELSNKELINFNPNLWKKLTDIISQNNKDVRVINYEDLFTLARNVGLFDDKRMITIKNEKGKDTQVHINELAFNFLQKFTNDVPIDKMHKYLSSMYANGISEEFIKFMSNKINYNEIISKINEVDDILTNLYDQFIEREKLKKSTGRKREILDNLGQVAEYQQKHLNKAVEIDQEREESKVPDFIVGKHIGQNRAQAYMEYAEKIKGIKDKILNEAGQIINNQVDISNKIFTYDTLAKSDLANFTIGFMTNCCAKLYGAGAGAMRAAILHKDMQPLVVRNDKDEIVAYSIMYINREEGYAILNDIEVNKRYEGQKVQLKTIYEKMRRCAIENIEEYNKTANVPITKLNCGISPNWTAVNENVMKNPQSPILKAPNFDDFKYLGSDSGSGEWHKGQWTIWEDDEIEK